jgi:O-antigen/teichoic acid export membrane protein
LIPTLFGADFGESIPAFQILMGCLVLATLHQAWLSHLMAIRRGWAQVLPPLLACGAVISAIIWLGANTAVEVAQATLVGYAILAAATWLMKRNA